MWCRCVWGVYGMCACAVHVRSIYVVCECMHVCVCGVCGMCMYGMCDVQLCVYGVCAHVWCVLGACV